MHELSELLFKVKSGKINDESDLFDQDDHAGYTEWDDNYFIN